MNDNITGKTDSKKSNSEPDRLEQHNFRIDLESIAKKKAYATTFSINVIVRVLDTLHVNGRLKRTNLGGKTGLSYIKCIKYIKLLQLLGWVEVILDVNKFVTITQKGIATLKIFS